MCLTHWTKFPQWPSEMGLRIIILQIRKLSLGLVKLLDYSPWLAQGQAETQTQVCLLPKTVFFSAL